MASAESQGVAEDAGPGPPNPAALGGSAPASDPLGLPTQAAGRSDPTQAPAPREPAGSDPPTPPEADPLDPFDRERLFDLLFRSQSRRLNEQRCPLPRRSPAPARPWHSLPATPTPTLSSLGGAGFFCSLTSLTDEQFFELVATAQARRMDDQRAEFAGPGAEQGPQHPPEPPDHGEELYSTILSLQSQRLEEQRSEPPIPLGAQELFDLLLRVQGGRMEEQRSEPPPPCCPTPAETRACSVQEWGGLQS
ncbi:G-protein-signaling modulator 3 [Carettochelys insculpta]|uniref:G-protein-signaling modulator 3 n=1 Tax=Carettochelys insculpta TaxID=44489 RepID=UPI003EBDB104